MLPAAAPYIFTGLRIGIGLSWLAIVAAEMLIGGVGIGFFIWDAWNSSRYHDIIVALVYIGIVGFVLDRIVAAVGHHRHPRHRGATEESDHEQPISRSTTSARRFTRGATDDRGAAATSTSTIEQGEFVSIIGHSGCGKSTLLNIVAGLLPVDHRRRAARGPRGRRARARTAPWCSRTTRCCPGSPSTRTSRSRSTRCSARRRSRAERHDWMMHNLDLVQMAHAKDKRPAEISGGMKQRVGIARALAMEPKVLLLDEPFGALDALTRAHLQDSVMEIHARLGNTVMMITHDVDEAVLLSDRIVMMTNGPAARIGEVLDVPLPRPRKRLELVGRPDLPAMPRSACSNSSTSATASSKPA